MVVVGVTQCRRCTRGCCRSDSVQEMYTQKEEVSTMMTGLDAQIETLETLKRGEAPPAPKMLPVPVKEPEVKVVEVGAKLRAKICSLRVSLDEGTGLKGCHSVALAIGEDCNMAECFPDTFDLITIIIMEFFCISTLVSRVRLLNSVYIPHSQL